MALRGFRPVRAWIKIAAATVSAAASAYVGLVSLDALPFSELLVVLAVAALAVISLGGSLRAILWEAVKDKLSERDESVRQMLYAAAFTAAEKTGLDVQVFTVSVFLVEGRWRQRHLARWMRVTFRARTESTVRWTLGKGVVGECWATGAVVKKDITGTNERWAACTPEQWAQAVRPAARMGLSYEEWVKTRGKYDMIIAVPIHRDGRFVGCLALDGPANGTVWAEQRDVIQALEVGAAHVATLLG